MEAVPIVSEKSGQRRPARPTDAPVSEDGGYLLLNAYQRGWIHPRHTGSGVVSEGLLLSGVSESNTDSLQVSSDGPALRLETKNMLNAEASVHPNEKFLFNVAARPMVSIKFKLQQTTNTRLFLGFTAEDASQMISADDPAGNYIGVQARAGDSNFFFVHKEGSTLTRVDTTVAVDTVAHILNVIVNSPTSVLLRFLDGKGETMQASATITSGLPLGTVDLEPMIGIENRAGGATRAFDFYLINAFARGA